MGNRSLIVIAAGTLLLLPVQMTRGAGFGPLTFEGRDWQEALDKVPCGSIKINQDGTRTVDGILVVGKDQERNPTISDSDSLAIIASHCHVCPQSLKTLGVPC